MTGFVIAGSHCMCLTTSFNGFFFKGHSISTGKHKEFCVSQLAGRWFLKTLKLGFKS